jgi:hypothetical protein
MQHILATRCSAALCSGAQGVAENRVFVLLCWAARITYGMALQGLEAGTCSSSFARGAVIQQGAAAGVFCAACASFGVVLWYLLTVSSVCLHVLKLGGF